MNSMMAIRIRISWGMKLHDVAVSGGGPATSTVFGICEGI